MTGSPAAASLHNAPSSGRDRRFRNSAWQYDAFQLPIGNRKASLGVDAGHGEPFGGSARGGGCRSVGGSWRDPINHPLKCLGLGSSTRGFILGRPAAQRVAGRCSTFGLASEIPVGAQRVSRVGNIDGRTSLGQVGAEGCSPPFLRSHRLVEMALQLEQLHSHGRDARRRAGLGSGLPRRSRRRPGHATHRAVRCGRWSRGMQLRDPPGRPQLRMNVKPDRGELLARNGRRLLPDPAIAGCRGAA